MSSEQATAQLVGIGAPAVPALIAALDESYSALDQLLARRDVKLKSLIAAALAPGSASYDKTHFDFDAVVRATTSRHAIIRADAASALGDLCEERGRARAVPIPVGLLADRSSEVRRLATLSLGWCRREAKPQLARIRAMLEDPAPGVRAAAENALHEITGRF